MVEQIRRFILAHILSQRALSWQPVCVQRIQRVTANMQCSYSKKAYPWDNACIESFHSLIKREWLNRFKIRDYGHAYRLVFEYLEAFYNTKRIHSHCDYMSPNDYEEMSRRLQQNDLQLVS